MPAYQALGPQMASFSPRLIPRPQPLPASDIFRKALVYHVRVPLLCAAFLFTVARPLYTRLASAWLRQGLSSRGFFVAATTAVHVILYWGCNLLTWWWAKRGVLRRYKIARMQREMPTRQLIIKTFKEAVIGQLLFEPAALFFIAWPIYRYCGAPAIDAALPSFWSAFLAFVIAYVSHDWMFYWAHRACHSAIAYRHVHKQHHTYRGSIGFAAEFASPVEQMVCMKVPTAAGIILMGRHPAIWLVWMSYRLCQTYEAHSGYCFYGSWLQRAGLTNSESAAFHDCHHTSNFGNFGFGPPSYLDYCFGTMDAWLAVGGIEAYLEKCRQRCSQSRSKPLRNIER